VWLHFGGLGPRRVKLPPDGVQFEPIGRIEPNPHSVLDSTDLVFIDPVSTGHSRVAKGEKPEQFFGVDEDIEAMGEFIRLYTTREGRWAAPKFVCGESYGGLRAGGLANYLQEKHGMFLSGVVLVSGVLEFQTVFAGNGNELPFITYLPSYAAVAHYHGKVAKGESLPALMEAARAFAYGDYARALLAGATLSEGERTRVAARLAEFTGLTAAEIEEVELRISPSFFRERLLRKERKILGRFDARVVSEDTDFVSPMPEFDPSFSNVIGPFSATANAYLRGELGYKSDQPYRVLSSLPWNYSKFANRYAGTSDRLAAAMKTNPKLRVFVAHGACDLAVPIGAIDYSMNHLDIPTSLRANIRRHAYDSGHMMYLYESDAERLGKDLSAFFQGR
jgi:carboxypeptidase C (cathepsin A)